MTLNELITSCEERTGWNDPNYRTRWISYLNSALREFARRHPWSGLEDEVTLAATSRFVVVPYFVDTIISVFDDTNNVAIDRGGDWDRRSPSTLGQRTTGRALEYDYLGDVPALTDPVGYLYLRSTHASDLHDCYLTGLVSNSGASGSAMASTIANHTVTATGTSPVTISTLFSRLLSVSKATDTNGDYFLHDAGAANSHLSFIAADEHDARFKRLQLHYIPSPAVDLLVRFRHRPPPLRDSNQAPPPAVKPDFLIHYAIALHHRQTQQYGKGAAEEQQALGVLATEVNRANQFDEPWSQLAPISPDWRNPDSDSFRGWW